MNPGSVALGDFNGDGRLDLVTANRTPQQCLGAAGAGDGTFQTHVSYPAGNYPARSRCRTSTATADRTWSPRTNDGNDVSVLMGRGDGTFQAVARGAATYAVGRLSRSVAMGDVNGDGRLDVVTANGPNRQRLGACWGVATGRSSRSHYPRRGESPVGRVGRPQRRRAFGSGHGGRTANPGTVSVLLGLGTGHSRRRSLMRAGESPSSLALADLNGDGRWTWSPQNSPLRHTSRCCWDAGTGLSGRQWPIRSAKIPSRSRWGTSTATAAWIWSRRTQTDGNVSVLLGRGDGTFRSRT